MSAYWDPIQDESEAKHDQTTKHEVRVEPDTFFKKDDGFRPICSCGWKGPGCFVEEDAEAGVRAHLREVGLI